MAINLNTIHIIEYTSPTSATSWFHSEYFKSDEEAECYLKGKEYRKEYHYDQKFEYEKDSRYKAYIFKFTEAKKE